MEPKTELDVKTAIAPAVFEPSLPIGANPAGEKRLVKDIGARLRQLAALKPGSSTKRTPEMIQEIIERLRSGETLLSVTLDPHICGHSSLYDWMDSDPELNDAITKAREVGAHILFDAKIDVAMGGYLATGDRLRDELVVKVLDQAAAKRNRGAFGDRIAVDATHSLAPVMLPTLALPNIPDGEFTESSGDDSTDC